MNILDDTWGRRIDPSVSRVIATAYVIYFLALLEIFFLPSCGILMIPAFGLQIGSQAISRSSYVPHARCLILCALIWAFFLGTDQTVYFTFKNTHYFWHTKMLGWGISSVLWLCDFFYLITQMSLLYKKTINVKRLFYRKKE